MWDYILPKTVMVDKYSYDCDPLRQFPFSSHPVLMYVFILLVIFN